MKNSVATRYKNDRATLADALDNVVEKGALVHGDVMLNLADIDLIYIKLTLALGSASLFGDRKKTRGRPRKEDAEYIENIQKRIKKIEKNIALISESDVSKEKTEKGIAKLVLTLLELIRDLLEREALRKIERGELSKTEIRKIGLSFKAFQKKVLELKKVFGIKEDLNIDLGPIGKLR